MPEMKTWTANGVQFTLPFAPDGFGLGSENAGEICSDANLALKNGKYRMSGGANGPMGIKYGWIEVTSRDSSYKIQRFYSTESTSLPAFERRYSAGVFSEWVQCDPGAFAPAGYGLGTECQYIYSWDEAVNNGFYKSNGNSPDGYWWWGQTISYGTGAKVQLINRSGDTGDYPIMMCCRVYDGTKWCPWEWVNPPMIPGEVYRTTERWNGKAVYTMLIESGTLVSGANVITFKELWPTEVIGIRITVGGAFNSPSIYGTLDSIYSVYHTVTKGVADIDITLFVGASHSGKNAKVQVWFVR